MKKKDYIIIAVILLVGLGIFFGLKTYLDKNYENKEKVKQLDTIKLNKNEYYKIDNLVKYGYLSLSSNYYESNPIKSEYCQNNNLNGAYMAYCNFDYDSLGKLKNKLVYGFVDSWIEVIHTYEGKLFFLKYSDGEIKSEEIVFPNKIKDIYFASKSFLNSNFLEFALLEGGSIYNIEIDNYTVNNYNPSVKLGKEVSEVIKYKYIKTLNDNCYVGINLFDKAELVCNDNYQVLTYNKNDVLVKYMFNSNGNLYCIDSNDNLLVLDNDSLSNKLSLYVKNKVKNISYESKGSVLNPKYTINITYEDNKKEAFENIIVGYEEILITNDKPSLEQ